MASTPPVDSIYRKLLGDEVPVYQRALAAEMLRDTGPWGEEMATVSIFLMNKALGEVDRTKVNPLLGRRLRMKFGEMKRVETLGIILEIMRQRVPTSAPDSFVSFEYHELMMADIEALHQMELGQDVFNQILISEIFRNWNLRKAEVKKVAVQAFYLYDVRDEKVEGFMYRALDSKFKDVRETAAMYIAGSNNTGLIDMALNGDGIRENYLSSVRQQIVLGLAGFRDVVQQTPKLQKTLEVLASKGGDRVRGFILIKFPEIGKGRDVGFDIEVFRQQTMTSVDRRATRVNCRTAMAASAYRH